MDSLNDKQLKNRWREVKKQINERQLLAYRVGIPLDKWDAYMHSVPDQDEVNRIYLAIQDDRKTKTARVREGLSKLVGYREAKEFSRKSGVSDTSIREIIEGQKLMAGYDIINKLELFLNAVLIDFELSIENPLTYKSYSQDYIGEIASEINVIANSLRHYCFELTDKARKQETWKDWKGEQTEPSKGLEYSLKALEEVKDKIDTFWRVYIERKL